MFKESSWACFSLQKSEHQFLKIYPTKLYEINSKTLFMDVGLTIVFQVIYTLNKTSLKSKVPLEFPENLRVIPWNHTFQRRFGEIKLPKRNGKALDLRRPLPTGGFVKLTPVVT